MMQGKLFAEETYWSSAHKRTCVYAIFTTPCRLVRAQISQSVSRDVYYSLDVYYELRPP